MVYQQETYYPVKHDKNDLGVKRIEAIMSLMPSCYDSFFEDWHPCKEENKSLRFPIISAYILSKLFSKMPIVSLSIYNSSPTTPSSVVERSGCRLSLCSPNCSVVGRGSPTGASWSSHSSTTNTFRSPPVISVIE